MIQLLTKIPSKIDKTIKFVFRMDDGLILEMAYIDNNTGKDIICVPSQTTCSMGCKFCHTTDYIGKLKLRNIDHREIIEGIDYIVNDLRLNSRMLLISFMGCGEPLLNSTQVGYTMNLLTQEYGSNIRFAVATMLPKHSWTNFFKLTKLIRDNKLPVKFHLSLHSPFDNIRETLIPNALDIQLSIEAFNYYTSVTNNAVEIHYSLIEGINDRPEDIEELGRLSWVHNIPIKFMPYNEKESSDMVKSDIENFKWKIAYYDTLGISYEFYTPPGSDIGASCGQFLFEYYLQYNKKPA